MEYYITDSPHYKSDRPHILYSTKTKRDMLIHARNLAIKHYMVDCWKEGVWKSQGAAIAVSDKTVYLYTFKDGMDVYYRINSDGSLSKNVSEKGIAKANKIMDHWR